MQVLESGRGTHFDPNLLDAFVAIARPLYDELSNQHIDKHRLELEAIVQKYFREEVGDLV